MGWQELRKFYSPEGVASIHSNWGRMKNDIRVDFSFYGHRKRKRLALALGLPSPKGPTDYLIDLWLRVAMERPDGRLTGWDEIDIADAAGWAGDPRQFVSALAEARWIEHDGVAWVIHDWPKHQPWVIGSEARSAAGSKAAKIRWAKRVTPQSNAEACEPQCEGMRTACEPHTNRNAEECEPQCPISNSISNSKSISNSNTNSKETDKRELSLSLVPADAGGDPGSQVSTEVGTSNPDVTDVQDDDGNVQQDVQGQGQPEPSPPKPSRHPPCPHQDIIAAYHAAMPANPRIRHLDETSQRNLRARWREDPERQTVDWWREFFAWCATSKFLVGQKTDFIADLMWLVRPQNFAKVLAGRYHHENPNGNLPLRTRQNMAAVEEAKRMIREGRL
jgi:hypothetical protein